MPRRALLGNWFEEEVYERDRRRLMQGRSGGLVEASAEVAYTMAKIRHHNAPHSIAPIADDGYLRFYVPLMLQNAHTCGFLSVDLDDRKASPTGWKIACSTAAAEEATSRCTIVLVPAAMPQTDSFPIPEDEADVVHYGQPFYLMTVRQLCEDPLFLMSESFTPGCASPVTGKLRYTYFSPDGGSAGAMWYVEDANPAFQEDVRDHPVKADAVIRIRHNMTASPLASLKEVFYNDFGAQFEVGCGHLSVLETKKHGGPPLSENLWMFIHDGQGLQEGSGKSSLSASAVTSAQGKSVQPLHGLGYEHLDCSACITVARALFNRINKTLAESPSTYLISHRLGKQNELRRRQYRNSELLVSEVMENVCTSYGSDEPLLRLHPKSKVRLYHQQVFGDVRLGVRHALREDEFYPADADPAAWADKGSMHRYPIAKLYSRKDAEALRGLQSRHAAPTMCALLVEEFEDEIEELVKAARTLAETEYGLCGMELPPKLSSPTLNGGTEGDNGSSVPLITNVCADVEVLRAAAHRDQQRWAQYQLREEKRNARRTQRKERETGGTATSVPATEASTQVGESNLHDSSAAPGANLMDSPPEEALHTSLASGVEKDAGDHTNDDL